MKGIKRRIVRVTFYQSKYNKPGYGYNRFLLTCGHEVVAKASQMYGETKICADCGRIERGEKER